MDTAHMAVKMTGGQALVQALYREGVRVIFGVPGMQQYHAVDAVYQEPRIRYISTRHEQATSYMADGYARVSGRVGTAMVVPGPGLFNAAAGIATAYAVSSPLLIVTGDAASATLPIGSPSTNTSEAHKQPSAASDESASSDQMDFLRPITKWTARADHPADIPAIVHESFHQLHTGRARPVEVEIAPEVLAAETEIKLLAPESYERPGGGGEQVERAARILAAARQPVVWAGGGAISAGASAVLQRLAEHLQAPVVTSPNGKGAISDRHPLSLGLAELRYEPLRRWLAGCDVILAVGTRTGFADRLHTQQVIRIDIDQAEIKRQRHHTLGIVGDARRTLEALHCLVAATPGATSGAEPVPSTVRALNAARFAPEDQLEPQHSFMTAIRSVLPDDAILVQGMNQMGYYSRNYYPVYAPGTYLTASSYGTLGSAYPLALGAKVAAPERAVVALSGDGGFLYNSQELATAVQYGINVVVIVFNDNAYGNVLRAQIEQFDGHILGTQLHNPDFVQLAKVYGARGVRAHDADQLAGALREALAIEAPTLIEVPVGMMERRY